MQMQVMPNFSFSGVRTTAFSTPVNSFCSSGPASSLSGNQSLLNSSFVRMNDSQLKSVPPRFIFPTVRPEGKVSTVCRWL